MCCVVLCCVVLCCVVCMGVHVCGIGADCVADCKCVVLCCVVCMCVHVCVGLVLIEWLIVSVLCCVYECIYIYGAVLAQLILIGM